MARTSLKEGQAKGSRISNVLSSLQIRPQKSIKRVIVISTLQTKNAFEVFDPIYYEAYNINLSSKNATSSV